MKRVMLIFLVVFAQTKAQVPIMGAINGPASYTIVPPTLPLIYSVTATNSPTSYTWTILTPAAPSVSANIISGQGTSSISVNFLACGQNVFTITSVASNSNGVSVIPSIMQTTISEMPCVIGAYPMLANGTSTICIGSSVTAVSNGALSYNWSANPVESFSTGLNTPPMSHQSKGFAYLSPTITTIYTVIGSCYGICLPSNPVTFTINVLDCTSLKESIKANSHFYIYPNPTRDYIWIKLNDNQIVIETVEIFNSIGQSVQEIKILGQENNSIDVTSLSPGFYTVQFKTELGSFTQKFVKE